MQCRLFVTLPMTKSEPSPSEFLIHAADVEGLCNGIDEELVKGKAMVRIPVCSSGFREMNCSHLVILALGKWTTIPTTYAGGAKC